MLKRLITYKNPFTEEEVTEEHYFHISKAELMKMEVEEHKEAYTDKSGKELTGMQAKLQRIVDAEDGKAIMREFEDIIRRSYGKKEGDRFVRSPEIWADFYGSGAFDQLLFEICTNAEDAGEFVNGLVPNDLAAIAADISNRAAAEEIIPEPNREARRASKKKPAAKVSAHKPDARLLTTNEMVEMDAQELQAGLSEGRYRLN